MRCIAYHVEHTPDQDIHFITNGHQDEPTTLEEEQVEQSTDWCEYVEAMNS